MKEIQTNFLKCPATGSSLRFEENELFSDKTSYPVFDDIPLLYDDIEQEFLSWATKLSQFENQEKNGIQHLSNLAQLEFNNLKKQRYQKISNARSFNIQKMLEVLEVFTGHNSIPVEMSTQHISSYFKLIFRDWSWGSEEVMTYVDFCKKQLSSISNGNILILGSGAGRLSYELANAHSDLNFFSIDHNPFLTFCANSITKGKTFELFDYDYYPKELQLTSKKYKIKYPALKFENHQFILSSFPNLPFNQKSFDAVICPWFLDILEMDFDNALAHAKDFLKSDGKLIYFGPSNIHSSDIYHQLTKEEIIEITKNHLGDVISENKTIEYLNNPIASQNRLENIIFASGLNNKNQKTNMHKLDVKNDKLDYSEIFVNYKNTNEIFYKVMRHINKTTNLEELVLIVQNEFQFNDKDALFYARTILEKIKTDLK